MTDFFDSRDEERDVAGNGSWILTFADLLSLLLTFFVLLYSMNAVQLQDWKPIVETMRRQFNPNEARIVVEEENTPELQRVFESSGLNLAYAEGLVAEWITSDTLYEEVQINRFEDRLVISMPVDMLFERKQAIIGANAEAVLNGMVRPLIQLGNKIIIEGHTDRRDTTGTNFVSNWELSLTRARIVAGMLTERGFIAPIGVAGYADTRFLQLDESLTLQERYDLAERIDIVILDASQSKGPYDIF